MTSKLWRKSPVIDGGGVVQKVIILNIFSVQSPYSILLMFQAKKKVYLNMRVCVMRVNARAADLHEIFDTKERVARKLIFVSH